MNEYKVTITVKNNTGFLPDFAGEEFVEYRTGPSAKAVHDEIQNELQTRYGYEIDTGKISHKIDIQKI